MRIARPTNLVLASCLWLTICWLGVLFAPQVMSWLPWEPALEPTVPLVCLPRTLQGEGDVTTSVGGFVQGCLYTVGLLLLVEVVKVALKQPRVFSKFALLVLYQVTLACDLLRVHANCWWVYLLSLLGVVTLDGTQWRSPLAPPLFPWPSCLVLMLLVGLFFADAAPPGRDPSPSDDLP
jgi:hypothetical protein